MKKVSIAATKQSRNISQQKLTIGLDLGDRNSWYCVLNEAGQIQLEQRVRTNAKALQEVFGAMPRSRIALEIGTHSPWISRLLTELGHEVIVANARKVRLIVLSRHELIGAQCDGFAFPGAPSIGSLIPQSTIWPHQTAPRTPPPAPQPPRTGPASGCRRPRGAIGVPPGWASGPGASCARARPSM